jgi:hypothetical protein
MTQVERQTHFAPAATAATLSLPAARAAAFPPAAPAADAFATLTADAIAPLSPAARLVAPHFMLAFVEAPAGSPVRLRTGRTRFRQARKEDSR